MEFEVHSELQYKVLMPTTFIFNLQVPTTSSQSVIKETLVTDPVLKFEEFHSPSIDARFLRLQVNKGINFKIRYDATIDLNYKIVNRDQLLQTVPVFKLDAEVIPYLFPSRYCQSDKLQKLAFKEFGDIENTYAKVLAITEWIYNNVEYVSGSTNSSTSAHDTLTERAGVCRDFAHLGITLCRALSIPARYFTAYAYDLTPPDFHACFEAYIGGEWIFFDPTKLVPVNGLVKIANGRDAADAPVASTFGKTICTLMNVKCETKDTNFKPFTYAMSKQRGLSYQ
ncbi:transglutaminase-like domain-containing protein [Ferruginibacter albus]|uniref:transglutaminase-like domain-containing protein n=1 Tax=Ferruginibacter albus TaxID=2875540 RepID=UPI001CC7B469|nr:transglutaminase family protein [Ferruginibacter albus]UAY52865.1 transglutaminase family protein [Ferruginibacter albus]